MGFLIRAAISGLLALPCLGLTARPVDLADRHIPFLVTADSILTGTLDTRFVAGGQSVQMKPELTSKTASQIYGLLVPGKSETTVTVNGAWVDLMPLERQIAWFSG